MNGFKNKYKNTERTWWYPPERHQELGKEHHFGLHLDIDTP
jgi:hypothetical protein